MTVEKNEILFYQNAQLSAQIEVIAMNETVWLNRKQLAELFDRDIKTIGKHINNILKEELKGFSVVANFAITGSDGKTYQVQHYNLDVIVSLGFRVKSQRGIHFRMWANHILKDHMMRGYSLSKRIIRMEDRMEALEENVHDIRVKLNKNDLPLQGIFFDGQVFDALVFSINLISRALHSIILIDNYVDERVLTLFSKKKTGVKVLLFTSTINPHLDLAAARFNEQFSGLEIRVFRRSHDRFLIIDEKEIYHIGASLKDLGKKWFAFTKLNIAPKIILDKIKR